MENRYKPLLGGAEVAKPECVEVVQRSVMTADSGPIPRKGTTRTMSWPKEVDISRYEKPVQSQYWGANMTIHDRVTIEEKNKTTAARGQIPPNGVTMDRSWSKDIISNRNEKPVWTPSLRAEVRKTDCVVVKQKMRTIEAEGLVNRADKVEPGRSQETAVGAGTGGTNNIGGRCTDCNRKKTMTARTLQTKCDDLRKPISDVGPPIVTKMAPTDETGVMHYQWIVRESVRTTEMLMPSNYLEIPELRLPRVFLHLAEEARNVEVVNDLSRCSEEVQPQGTGLSSPVLVTVMVDSQPIPNKRVLRTTDAPTGMMTNIKYVGRCKPIDRADQVVSTGTAEQPIWLGLNTDARGNASADTGGPDGNSAIQSEPVGP